MASLDDLKGLKIPHHAVADHGRLVHRARHQPRAAGLYRALHRARNRHCRWPGDPYANVIAAKFYEVQKYLTNTRHLYNPYIFIVSKKFWDTLNADEQKLFKDAAAEARTFQRKVNREKDADFLKQIKEHGMQVTDLSPAELAKFQAAVRPVVDKYTNSIGPDTMKLLFAGAEGRLKVRRHDKPGGRGGKAFPSPSPAATPGSARRPL